jgi:hypothetical protein
VGNALARKTFLVLSVLTTALGAGAICIAIRDAVAGTLGVPFETWSLAIGLFLLGAAGLRYDKLRYRGGVFSIFGAFLAVLAFFDVGYILEKLRTRDDLSLGIDLAVFFTLAIPAFLLLLAGKMRHDQSTDAGEAT